MQQASMQWSQWCHHFTVSLWCDSMHSMCDTSPLCCICLSFMTRCIATHLSYLHHTYSPFNLLWRISFDREVFTNLWNIGMYKQQQCKTRIWTLTKELGSPHNWLTTRINQDCLHSKIPHVVTVLWPDSDDVVTILSPTSGTSGRLQNRVSVPPWFLHSDCVWGYLVSSHVVTVQLPTRCLVDRFLHRLDGNGYLITCVSNVVTVQ